MKLNIAKAWKASGNPYIFSRLEDCMVAAKTEVTKRRLFRTCMMLQMVKTLDAVYLPDEVIQNR